MSDVNTEEPLNVPVSVPPTLIKRPWRLLSAPVLLGALFVVMGTAWAGDSSIHWDTLNLTAEQQSEIERLESQWRKVYGEVYPQIQRDKNELRRLLNSVQCDDRQVMEIQERIQTNEQRLRQEATRTFLNKKGQLNQTQKMRLHQMMVP